MRHTVRSLRKQKDQNKTLQMLTCYDFQTAQVLNETELDLILVGDSLGNVILGYDTTVNVSLTEMKIFGSAVKRGAPDKFVVVDLPFGTYATYDDGLKNSLELFQTTGAEAVKLEGANKTNYQIIQRLTETGVPVMGHIGLQPQSVHSQGGYFKHGKSEIEKQNLMREAKELQAAGCFSLVLECVESSLAKEISESLDIPTIGIGSGTDVDGQVLVLNDLLGMGVKAPSFVNPIANLHQMKKELIKSYLN